MNANKKNALTHLAIIMDGNGRWAEKNDLPRLFGHEHGLRNIKNIVEFSVSSGIKYLTLFAFSTENFFRPKEEVNKLIELFDFALSEYLDIIIKNNLSFQLIGDRSILNDEIKNKVINLEKITEENEKMKLIVAFNYGGKDDIVNCVKNIAYKVRKNEIDIEKIDEGLISTNLYTAKIPDPDLLIRTGGQKRLSNFLLWQLSYAELFFCDDYWPEFDANKLQDIINEYLKRKRNFGKI